MSTRNEIIRNAGQKELIQQAALCEVHSLKGRLSAPLDRFLWLESSSLDALVEGLAEEILVAHTADRAPRESAKASQQFFVKSLLLNLLLLHKSPRRTLLAISKRAEAYTNEGRYSQALLSYRTMKQAYDWLLENGYIKVVTNGFYDGNTQKGEVTRIDITPKLALIFDELFPEDTIFFIRHVNEEIVHQKDADKKRIDYSETAYSRKARRNLQCINANLNRHWYDIELTNEEFEQLYDVLAAKRKGKPNIIPTMIDYSARSLYRVFNNGSSTRPELNFKEGGRFYGGWWQKIPSHYRRYITINQKHTVEVDYSNLHPQMLYALAGATMQGDAYTVPGLPRPYVKKAFAQLLNGKARVKTPRGFKTSGLGMKWKTVLAMVAQKHEPVRQYFGSGYGLTLQRMDSEILEEVLLYFAKRNIPCLPIHDSIIIHHAHADELKQVMSQAYVNAFSDQISFKVDNNYDYFVERNYGAGEDTQPIEVLLRDPMESDYERRWMAWLSQKLKY